DPATGRKAVGCIDKGVADTTDSRAQAEDEGVQDPHPQLHGKRPSVLLRRADRDRPQTARASDSRPSAALSSRRGGSEQFSGSRTDWASISAPHTELTAHVAEGHSSLPMEPSL